MRLGPEKKPYTTRRAHGEHPKGSYCLVSRPDFRVLTLEFPNGDVIELARNFFAEGLEDRPMSLMDLAIHDIQQMEDAAVLGELNKAIDAHQLNKTVEARQKQ
jgi:hypothetical protein